VTTALDVRVIPPHAAARPRRIPWERLWWVPLATILAAQTALSVSVISRNPSLDEARYIVVGHQLIYELFHGGGSPFYETYFSGAPVIYSPLAAMADHVGGLVAVRIMSLYFLLTATGLLYASARRLFGYWPGVAGAALFAMVGLTHFVGTYANYDAMALMILAAATYCAVRAGESDDAGRWLIATFLLLVAANSTKYASLLFDPVIIGLAALQMPGWNHRMQRLLALGAATVLTFTLFAYLAGTTYVKGILLTTLARNGGSDVLLGASYASTSTILSDSEHWIGIVIGLGLLSLLAALLSRDSKQKLFLLGVTVAAGLLVTVEALHLHSAESMSAHDDFSVWFASIAGGYALATLPKFIGIRPIGLLAATAGVAVTAFFGLRYSPTDQLGATGYGGSTLDSRIDVLAEPYLSVKGGQFLVSAGSGFQMAYRDGIAVPWWRLTDDNYIKYPIPARGGDVTGQVTGRICETLRPGCIYLTGPMAYRAAIHAHWFALISLYSRGSGSPVLEDRTIIAAVENTPGYVLITRLGGAPTWIYAPDYKEHGHGR
jgi:hypothetical protein